MDEYDVVVLGGGSGSHVASAAAAEGYEAAVLEPGPLGGACITRGCVPSKALIHRADVCREIRRADRFGIDAELTGVDFGAITDAVHETVFEKADRAAEGLREAERVTLYEAAGRFVDDREVELDGGESDGERIRGEQVVVAVGGRPIVPPIGGIEDVDYLTSDDALFLDERPDRLAIVGGGYIGAELAHFFDGVGADVSIVGRSDVLVPGEAAAASEAVTRALGSRCDVYTSHEASEVRAEAGEVVVVAEGGGDDDGDGATDGGDDDGDGAGGEEDGDGAGDERDNEVEIRADELLLATGRRPNTDELGLEETAVETDDRDRVVTDERLETDVDGVWALGDVLPEFPFKHVADREAEVVAANVLAALEGDDGEAADEESGGRDGPTGDRETVDRSALPHAIFTDPRVASVGATAAELDENDVEYERVRVDYAAAPLGLILDEDEAFVEVLADPDGEILGCHVVGPEATTLIHEAVVAMNRGSGTVDDVAETVHVHPALNEVVLAAFDELSDRRFSTAPDWRDVAGK